MFVFPQQDVISWIQGGDKVMILAMSGGEVAKWRTV